MKEITLKIKDMHCTSCAMSIDMDLEDTKGVENAKTSYAKAETVVKFDETLIKVDQVVGVIKQTGYTAELK